MGSFIQRKLCGCCKDTKVAAEFHKRSASADGLSAKCKSCQQAYDRARLRKPDRVEYRARYRGSDEGKAKVAKGVKAWGKRNPEKRSATHAVNNALRDGRMTRPAECSACGSGNPLEAHHDDYTQRLAVRWLCIPCHNQHHMAQRDLARNNHV